MKIGEESTLEYLPKQYAFFCLQEYVRVFQLIVLAVHAKILEESR